MDDLWSALVSYPILSFISDGDLKAELEAMLRLHYEPSFVLQRQQQERLRTLTDEEWWEQQIQFLSTLDSPPKALYEGAKEYMIEHRFDLLISLDGDGLQHMIDAEVQKLMPELIRLRLELNEDGPLTAPLYLAASIRSSQSQIAEMSETLKQAVGRQTHPRIRDFMAKFAENVELDIEDMRALNDPEISQEQLDSVTSRMTDRMNELTASLKPNSVEPE